MLRALAIAMEESGDTVSRTTAYAGAAQVLVVFGIGADAHNAARNAHLDNGGRVLHFDLGYFGIRKHWLRMSIDHDHPQHLLDMTPADPVRWDAHHLALRKDARDNGPILLVGLGRKSRQYLGLPNWERDTLRRIRAEFPRRQVIYRPKGHDGIDLRIPTDPDTPIAELLRGASLVVCRHSNVAVDAAIAGVPFQAENGAATWLQGREYTAANRLDFLRRLSHWQYNPTEATQAWAFAKRIMQCA